MPTASEPLLSPQEVAEFLGVPVASLQTWRAGRRGPRVYKVGRHVRYRRADVERWLAQRVDVRIAGVDVGEDGP